MDDMTRIFTNWPAAIPCQGVVVTAYGESIPFQEFLLTEELVLLLRPMPDSAGTRRVIMRISDIIGVRIVDPIEPERFTVMGFQNRGASISRRLD